MKREKYKKYLSTLLASLMISSVFVVPTIIDGQIKTTKISSTKTTSSKIIAVGYATIDGVSVRSRNSASGSYLGSLYTGDKVEIIEKSSNNWYKFKYKNTYAYVSSTYINLEGTKAVDNVLNTGIVYKVNKLAVREDCSTKSKILGYLPKDTQVSIVRATSNNWYKIRYNNSYAYVSGSHIKLTPSVKVMNRGTATATLNVRKNASKTSSKLGSIKKDEIVAVLNKQSNGWYKIIHNNQYGYIHGQYVKIRTTNLTNRKNLNDFLFVGDSFTSRMEKTIKSKNEGVYVHAQGGSRSSYWLDKVDEMPDKSLVDSVSILIGTNGVTTSSNLENTKALINQLIVKYPYKTIYVQKAFPVGRNFTGGQISTYNKAINQYNKDLKKFCDTKANVKFIDATNNFVDSKGYLINTSDGLHINESKNNIFYNNIFNAIKTAEKSK